MTAVRYDAPFLKAAKAGRSRRTPPPQPPKVSIHADRRARQLALAYRIEQAIEEGELCDYADAARRLGVTRSRISQVMELLLLPVTKQEAILLPASVDPNAAARRVELPLPTASESSTTSHPPR